ncbi:MAG TPA: LysR family transcriptional regulator [Burkholderiaceae bacterium]|nr:LysR family transcriptional regulator [Burkholderiaceae bacterium]
MERRVALDQLDFRLLNAFVAVYRERHVGRAADALGMSQPTVSTLLARLRHVAGDPLFIRSAQGMQPTALAREWAEPVATALAAFAAALNAPSGFDPASSRRVFVIYMTDVGQSLILNQLVAQVEAAAPGVRIRVVSSWDGTLADRLDDGAIDIAFGWIPQLKARKTSTPLFKDRYVGLQDAARSAGRGAAEAPRYAVAWVANSAHQIVSERFQLHDIRPAVTVPSFFMLPEVLMGTSLTGVVPERLAGMLLEKRRATLRVVELPFKLPALGIRLHWSAGTWRDEGIEWLRSQVLACVKEYLSAGASAPARRRHP